MITRPTVLVLGAGASYPYGFPTADGLRQIICEEFSSLNKVGPQLLGLNSSYSPESFVEFRNAFLKGGQPSIDAFLEKRRDFLGVGKLAIAYCLMPFENEDALYQPNPQRGGDWYMHLSVKLTSSFEDFGTNKLSIITFNYDRSLEHFLLTALHNLHGRPLGDCAEQLAKIPIIHVYGQLGRDPYLTRGPESWPYRPRNDRFIDVEHASKGITLLHEEVSGDLANAREFLVGAEIVCFLGFGYHELNISRLAIDTTNVGSKTILGTTRGLIGREIHAAQEKVQKALGSLMNTSDSDSLEMLRTHLLLG